MKLPFSLFTNKDQNPDYYLALILDDEKASAVILHAENGILKTINTNEEYFTQTLEELSVEDLITICDRTISKAEDVLPPDVQTHNTVFGLKESWIDKETKKISRDNLDKLKKVCNSLDLKPIGFMITIEAITHLIQDEEGAPVSALFAEVTKRAVTVSLFRGGKVIETISHPHTESAPVTADTILSHFTVPVLPARFILYQSKLDERTSHAFTTHHWSKSLPFLHVPQVTVLPERFDTRAVLYGAATQMGMKVSEKDHIDLPKTRHVNEEAALTAAGLPITSAIETEEQKADELTEEQQKESDFGFKVDQDVANGSQLTSQEAMTNDHFDHTENFDAEDRPTAKASNNNKIIAPFKSVAALPFLKNLSVPNAAAVKGFFSGKNKKLKIIIPVAALLLVVIATSLFYNYGMKATVSLKIAPDVVDQEETVTFSTADSSDFSGNVIAAQKVTAAIDATVSTNATGKKDAGDKAKGNVTFYNNDNETITLSSGTEITAPNGEVFVLDKEVRVASESGDIFSGTEPGTTDGSVTAKEQGKDGNVPSGTRFRVESRSSLAARNDSAFSGGTTKEVTVVAPEDIAKLKANIVKSAQGKGKSELAKQADEGLAVLPLVSGTSLEKPDYSKDLGEEASKVTLKAIVVFSGIAYDKKELEDYAQEILKKKGSDKTTIAKDSIKSTIEDAEANEKGDQADATVKLQAGLLPTIDEQDIIASIKGKSAKEARNMVSSLPQVVEADIKFSPPIPFLPSLFPTLPKKVAVEVTSE